MENDLITKATLLYSMKDNIIHFFEGHETTKQIIDALKEKYGPRSE
jgi:hypothetical protein